ncbi:MAG TPA: hypothetical protein DDZ81_15150 [Acetobacteraceae bacterium]|jgi:hypothetical protein|nr:hypothetical protein [Acetobacteraceae bacterium]
MTIWMAYFLAAVAASGAFIAAGWRSRRILTSSPPKGRYELPFDPLWGGAADDLSPTQPQSDVEAAVRLALKRLAPMLKSQSVQADIAVAPGLLVRMRVDTLADLVEELLGAAVHAAPTSRLLLTASAHGDQVEISITDDVPGAAPDVRAASVRGLMERVSIRGGSLNIDVHPAEGTTMTLRLAAGVERRTGREPRDATRAPVASWNAVRRTVEPY